MSAGRGKGSPVRALGMLRVRLWPNLLVIDLSMLPVIGSVLW